MRRSKFNGKADRFAKKHGKLARQLDAKTRQAENGPVERYSCGHKHSTHTAQKCPKL